MKNSVCESVKAAKISLAMLHVSLELHTTENNCPLLFTPGPVFVRRPFLTWPSLHLQIDIFVASKMASAVVKR